MRESWRMTHHEYEQRIVWTRLKNILKLLRGILFGMFTFVFLTVITVQWHHMVNFTPQHKDDFFFTVAPRLPLQGRLEIVPSILLSDLKRYYGKILSWVRCRYQFPKSNFLFEICHISCPNFICNSLNFEPNLTNEEPNERAVFVD